MTFLQEVNKDAVICEYIEQTHYINVLLNLLERAITQEIQHLVAIEGAINMFYTYKPLENKKKTYMHMKTDLIIHLAKNIGYAYAFIKSKENEI